MFPVLRRTDETRPPGHRYRCIGAQGIGKRGQAVAAAAVVALLWPLMTITPELTYAGGCGV